jgi:hypothetical protein
MCPRPASAGQSGGVNIAGKVGRVRDIVGGNKITYGLDAEELLAA